VSRRATWLELHALARALTTAPTPPAITAATLRHARALVAALDADATRGDRSQEQRAADWGVVASSARRHGLRGRRGDGA
jgi:hypothetical protein